MRFPRQARILRGPLDATPVAGVLFLLALFILITSLLYTPGTPLDITLPDGQPAGGTDNPSVVVKVDKHGQYFFENAPMEETDLKEKLRQAARQTPGLNVILRADKGVELQVLTHLWDIFRQAGVTNSWVAAHPTAAPTPP
jgi:biopolymer transport protein ExbD